MARKKEEMIEIGRATRFASTTQPANRNTRRQVCRGVIVRKEFRGADKTKIGGSHHDCRLPLRIAPPRTQLRSTTRNVYTKNSVQTTNARGSREQTENVWVEQRPKVGCKELMQTRKFIYLKASTLCILIACDSSTQILQTSLPRRNCAKGV